MTIATQLMTLAEDFYVDINLNEQYGSLDGLWPPEDSYLSNSGRVKLNKHSEASIRSFTVIT